MSEIKVEVCQPEFEDEFFISYIKNLDKSKVYNLETYMSVHNMIYALKNDENHKFHYNEIKYIEGVEAVNIGDILELDDIIECDYHNLNKIFRQLDVPLLNFSKYYTLATDECNSFLLKFRPDLMTTDDILALVKDYHVTIPYSIFITMVILAISCIRNKHIQFFEIYPRLDDKHNMHVELIIQFTRKDGRTVCDISQMHTPYLTITGFRKRKSLFER